MGRVRAVPRLCEFYPGICLTTEEKHVKPSVRVAKIASLQITKTRTLQNPHIHTPTHYKTHTYTHPHITKQFKTTTVQVKTNTVQDIPKWNIHNIIKYPQCQVNGALIHKNFTVTHFTSLYPQELHRKSLQFTSLLILLHLTRRHWRLDQLLVNHHYRHN